MKNLKFYLIGLCSFVSFCYSPYAPHQDDYVAPADFFDRFGNFSKALLGVETERERKLKNKLVDRRNELEEKDIKLKEKDIKLLEKDMQLTGTKQSFEEIRQESLKKIGSLEEKCKQRIIDSEKMLAEIRQHRKKTDSESSNDSDKTAPGVTPSTSAQTSPELKPTRISCPHCSQCIFLLQSTANSGK